MDPFLGEIRPLPFNFAPTGWAFCQGQLIPISQNTALFSLLGTYYGGNGTSTFALPNFQGRVGINQGQGPGLSPYSIGEVGGSASVSLTIAQMPSHSHTMGASSVAGSINLPSGKFPAKTLKNTYAPSANANFEPSAVTFDGGGQPHNNMQPFLVLNYCIATQGVFPSRP